MHTQTYKQYLTAFPRRNDSLTSLSIIRTSPVCYFSGKGKGSISASQNVYVKSGTMILTYLLRIAVLSEKLAVSQLLTKFPEFYETRKFFTAFTKAHHHLLYWDGEIHFMPSSQVSRIHFNIILPSTAECSKWSPVRFLHQNPLRTFPLFPECANAVAISILLTCSPELYLMTEYRA
jgi:hypothetical protein